MDNADSFMNWGFKPQKSIKSFSYANIIYLNEEDWYEATPQEALIQKNGESLPNFIRRAIVSYMRAITNNFPFLDYTDIMMGNEKFPIVMIYKDRDLVNIPLVSTPEPHDFEVFYQAFVNMIYTQGWIPKDDNSVKNYKSRGGYYKLRMGNLLNGEALDVKMNLYYHQMK
jgi:hypothetical protein